MNVLDKLKSAIEVKNNTIKSYLPGMREDAEAFYNNLCKKIIENIEKSSQNRRSSFIDRFPTENNSVLNLFELMYKDEIYEKLKEKGYKIDIRRYNDGINYGIEAFVSWK